MSFPETFQVTSLIKSKKYDIEDLVKTIGVTLQNHTTANILIRYDDRTLDKFSTNDTQLEALLDKTPLPDHYNLLIRSTASSVESIIAHEMVHFDQYKRGDLDIKRDDNKISFLWKGVEWPSSSDYWSRPWEKEARNNKYIKEYKKLKNV